MNKTLTFSHAKGSTCYSDNGDAYFDLSNGFGTVFLGHSQPDITRALNTQIGKIWVTNNHSTRPKQEAKEQINNILPQGLKLANLYSTGMEACEFSLRLASALSGKQEFAAFTRSMHGKSAITADLCWPNSLIKCSGTHSIPFVDTASEESILEQLMLLIKNHSLAAVIIEPIQGSNGCHEASINFYDNVITLCQQYGVLSIFDETLTGLYRTGPCFYSERLQQLPDILIFAKSMANGFPASSVAVKEALSVPSRSLPGSTFSDNPLAATAISASIKLMQAKPIEQMVNKVGQTIINQLSVLEEKGAKLRGKGALWSINLGENTDIDQILYMIRDNKILVSSHGRFIRILPGANVDLDTLDNACETIKDICLTTLQN